MTEENKVFQIVRHCIESALLEHDVEKTMQVISEDIIGVGMGDQGTVSSRKEVLAILKAQNASTPDKYQIEYPKIDIRCFSNEFATGSIFYKVTSEFGGETVESNFVQTIAAKKEQGEWMLCLLQAIPLDLSEKGIEQYPLKFADSTLAKLKSELQQDTFDLMNSSFSGGILSSHAEYPYPLYFANDAFISMLGYEREEFEAVFKSGLSTIFTLNDTSTQTLDKNVSYKKDSFMRIQMIKKDGGRLWVELCSRRTTDGLGNDILLSVVIDISEIVNLQLETNRQNQTILSSIEYSAKIQKNLLPSKKTLEHAFKDYSVLWSPKDVVGGDIFWIKEFEDSRVLCLCDCTGHGTPGALLTMLVVSAFDNMITKENCRDTAQIIRRLDEKISTVLNVNAYELDKKKIDDIRDGCDLAVLHIDKDGDITISAANTYIFVCDGKKLSRVRGQRLNVGDGTISDKTVVKTTIIPYHPANRFYISSDGLFDQIGGKETTPMGFQKFEEIVLSSYDCTQKEISQKIWDAFEEHRGTNLRRDDVEMISFIP